MPSAEYQRAWRARHPGKQAEYSRNQREDLAKRDLYLTLSRSWKSRNQAHVKGYYREWDRRNPEKKFLRRQRRAARENGARGTCSPEQLLARISYYGGRCWMCQGSYDSIDHVVPLSRGGTNWPANLRPACRPCNSRKKDRPCPSA